MKHAGSAVRSCNYPSVLSCDSNFFNYCEQNTHTHAYTHPRVRVYTDVSNNMDSKKTREMCEQKFTNYTCKDEQIEILCRCARGHITVYDENESTCVILKQIHNPELTNNNYDSII